ncbi:XdhC family protein [Paenibacillus xylanilyticus]|uniref:XdhC family protein n=1 Tax=Paenibacillus xylanilyticus TaxID=248903 RepID=UPI00399F0B84
MDMHDLCTIAAREARCVLATAVKVEGHAYRKQGVSMLLTEDGRMYGSISPGCLESDLQARVERVLDTEQMEFVEYDMRPEDDLSWGETIGCGGLVIIMLEPVCSELRTVISEMHACFQSGSAVELTRTFLDQYSYIRYGWKRIISIDGKHDLSLRPLLVTNGGGTAKSGRPLTNEQDAFTDDIDSTMDSNPDRVDTPHLALVPVPLIDASNVSSSSAPAEREKTGGSTEADDWNLPPQMTTLYTPKPRLIMIGAGNDAIPVARLARAAGFRVIVADWREGLCTAERFPNVEIVLGFPHEIIPVLDIKSGDYIILMSHQFPREREFLELMLDCDYSYLGIMGSKTRTARLLKDLPPLPNVHSPVGLSIGADGPEEIAISIAAELVACRRAVSNGNRPVQRGNIHASDGHCARGR